jgi:hypothetical protein
MRLLKLVGQNEFSLVQVPTHDNLPYAILSHTWTPGQEVTYQELITSRRKSKTDYEKIKFYGEQAIKDVPLVSKCEEMLRVSRGCINIRL